VIDARMTSWSRRPFADDFTRGRMIHRASNGRLAVTCRRRSALAESGLACFAALSIFCSIDDAKAADKVEYGTTSRNDATSIATYIAFEKKLFESEGLDIDWLPAGSAARAAQQTVAGSLDISIAATDATIRAISQGANLKIVAGSVQVAPFRTIGGKGITDWSQLKGKTISVGGPSDQTLFFLHVMARKNNLADKDYDLIYGGTTPDRFSQLVSGGVAAAVLTDPEDLMATDQGFNDLGSAPDYVPVWAQNNVYVNENWALSHRNDVVAFIRALRKAADFFYDAKNKDETITIMAKYTHADVATATRIYQFFQDKHVIAPQAKLFNDGLQAVVDSLVEMRSLTAPIAVSDLTDGSYIAHASQQDDAGRSAPAK
jgi:NitT/TauT family transport system substrate-binding protein